MTCGMLKWPLGQNIASVRTTHLDVMKANFNQLPIAIQNIAIIYETYLDKTGVNVV